MHGPGRFVWNDKKVYEGNFHNGNLHGKGIITYPTGQKAEGIWEYGENLKIENIESIKWFLLFNLWLKKSFLVVNRYILSHK